MIISHEHKFIFIKTAKTAGTSLEIALSKFCHEGDIITPLIQEDELFRISLKYQTPANYYLKLNQYKLIDYKKLFLTFVQPQFGRHCSAKFIKLRIPTKTWNSYYKFCFDRNPWDKAISLYFWQTRHLVNRPKFSAYFNCLKKNKLSNFNKYSLNGEVIVDNVFKYEELDQSLEHLSNKLNLPIQKYMPKTKHNIRTDRQDYSQVLSMSQEKTIREICKNEIKLLNY